MKTALVTGAGRRIGAGLAQELGRRGFNVAVHFRTSADEAEKVAQDIRDQGGQARTFQANLADIAATRALVDAVHAAFGGLDVLVNSAAAFDYDTLDTLTPDTWRLHLDANLTGPVFLTKAFADRLAPEARGLVINLLDQKVSRPNPDYFSYTAAKLALAQLTPVLAMALAPKVRVCGISPGITLPSGAQSEADYRRAAAATPSGVSSTLDDLSRALVFILETPSFSGQVLTIDGGESLLGRTRDVAYDVGVQEP